MNTQSRPFTSTDWPFWFNCKPCIAHLLSCVFILSCGCRHSATKSLQYSNLEKEVNEVWNTENSESPVQSLTVDYVTANPSPYLNGNVMISGAVTDLRVKKGPRGNMMLELKLNGKSVPQTLTASKKDFTRLKLAGQLESIGELMLESAQNIELSNLEPSIFKNMSYGLKIEGNRIQALSQFYRSKELFEIGDDIESIAHGYLKLGDAIYTFSEIIIGNEPNIVLEQIDIEPIRIDSINDSNELQGAIKEVCKELCAISEELVNNRYKIMEKKLVFDSQDISNTKAYSLLSIGDLLKAKSWESKKNQEQAAELQFEIVSKGFTLLGKGMTNLYDGFRNLGSKLSLKVTPPPSPSSETPILKCAYIGYNEQIINDCKEKMMQLGKNDEITIQGQLIKGNLLEELNVLWINMQSVTIDDLTFDLAYDDVPTTWRNLTSLYDWVKETTN